MTVSLGTQITGYVKSLGRTIDNERRSAAAQEEIYTGTNDLMGQEINRLLGAINGGNQGGGGLGAP